MLKQEPYVGVIASVESDSLLSVNGVIYVEESISRSFSPRNVSEEKFQKLLDKIRHAKVKVRSANVFIPGQLKLVGPDINESAILGFVDTVMRRCKEAGVEIIVLGSGEARKIPSGFDSTAASKQFISIGRKMAKVAAKYERIIAIENLNHTETNFVLSLRQAIDIVKAIDHKNFRLTADLYHMLMENEPADHILAAKGLLVNVHIAEKEERAYPGKRGTDFRPYFCAMKKIGYSGGIMMECKWWDFGGEVGKAKSFLEGQLQEAYQ